MLPSAANATGKMAASVPPATTTSTSPCSMSRCASTNACTPAAQAATEVMTGPVIPFWMLIWHAAIDGDIIGTVNGLTRSGPFVISVTSPRRHLLQSAATGVHDHGHVVAVVLPDCQAGVIDRLARGGDRQLAESAHPPRLLEVDPVARIEVLHLGRDAHVEVARVELGDRRDPGDAARSGSARTSRRHCRSA